MTATPLIETGRLRLRAHRRDDFAALHALWRDPAVYTHITGRPSTSEESWARLLRYAGHWQLMGFGYWAIEDKASGAFIGEAGLADYRRDIEPPFGATPEMGWLIDPEFHLRGLASEALRAIIGWGRVNIAAPQYACMIAPDNAASVALAASLGFRETGRTSYHGQPTILMRLSLAD